MKIPVKYLRHSSGYRIYEVTDLTLYVRRLPHDLISKIEVGDNLHVGVPNSFCDYFLWNMYPEEIRARILRNADDPNHAVNDTHSFSFDWKDSPEGYDFWNGVFNDYQIDSNVITDDNWRILLNSYDYQLIQDDLGTGEYKLIRK